MTSQIEKILPQWETMCDESIKVIKAGHGLKPVQMPGAVKCKMQELLTEAEGAPNFAMRLFEIEPGGHTPQHSHPWEHEIYVLSGEGEIRSDSVIPFKSSEALLVPSNILHQFYNSSSTQPLRFLCLIPNTANYNTQSSTSSGADK